MVAAPFMFWASSAPVPPLDAFFPTEKTTNGAFEVRVVGEQPALIFVTVVDTTLSNGLLVKSPKQFIVVALIPSVLVSGLDVAEAHEVLVDIVNPRTA